MVNRLLLLLQLQIVFWGCETIDDKEVFPNDDEICYEASVFTQIKTIGTYKGIGAQGFAVYDDIGFCFYDTGYCQTIDLIEKKIISSFKLPGVVGNPQNHCGVACFSDTFMNIGDRFPLLYLSSYKEMRCYVLRMKETEAECIQVIQMKDEEGNVIPSYAFMPDGDKLVLKANLPNKQDGIFTYKWVVVKRPIIDVKKEGIIHPQDVLSSFFVKSSDAYNAGFCKKGRIYQLAGYGGNGSKKMYIIDHEKGQILKEILWKEEFLYSEEHEQCSPYGDDGILINYNKADYISYVRFLNWKF